MLLDARTALALEPAVTPAAQDTEVAAPTLEVIGVSKQFGATPVLQDVHLAVDTGELVCLLGPSGCGKSTLLRILCGIERAKAGAVRLHGRDITHMPPGQRRFGVVFQSYALFPTLSVADNVAYGLHGLSRERAHARVMEMLDLVGLAAHAHKRPAQLSGGQQQRVALARALAPQPEVLLLDEPLSALDPQVRHSMREEIVRLQRNLKMTTLMVTHDQDEALAMADRVVLMRDGRVSQVDTPWQLYAHPATAFAAGFLGRMNVWPARVVGADEVRVGQVHLRHAPPLSSGSEVGRDRFVAIRPEAIEVRALTLNERQAARAGLSSQGWLPNNVVEARLQDWTFCGPHIQLIWDVPSLGQTLETRLPTPACTELPWQRGEGVGLYLPPQALNVLAESIT